MILPLIPTRGTNFQNFIADSETPKVFTQIVYYKLYGDTNLNVDKLLDKCPDVFLDLLWFPAGELEQIGQELSALLLG